MSNHNSSEFLTKIYYTGDNCETSQDVMLNQSYSNDNISISKLKDACPYSTLSNSALNTKRVRDTGAGDAIKEAIVSKAKSIASFATILTIPSLMKIINQ